ncbi:alginate export family protein [Haliea sp. E17]|uniref:alginate export family protein n=1 Tax=Haliea sp. E17 TaxID=3401576 RepID=UPI003AAAED67
MAVSNQARTLLAGAVIAACAVPVTAEEAAPAPESFTDMFTMGKASVDFRYRFEFVDQDGFDKDAEASTLRSRLTFGSAAYKGFSFLMEVDDVSTVGDDDYNSTANGKTQYPVVADPEGTDVNQVWAKYASGGASGTYGRQRILHGNQRFVGGVGWRQNEQTYDGFRALYSTGGLSLDASYVYNVNRIFGPDDGPVQPADLHGDNYLLRGDWKFSENHGVAAYAYLLDVDYDPAYPAGRSSGNSSDTYGVEYAGKFGPLGLKAAYATQSEGDDAPVDYDADYYMLEGAFTVVGLTATLGYEVLGAGDGVGFKTPYATLHMFQGWADQFLVTPGDGIEDLYVGIAGAVGPVKLAGYYHDFQAEDSGADYGTELDLVATWPVTKQLSLQLKYAGFSSDSDSYVDVDKAWMTVQFKI